MTWNHRVLRYEDGTLGIHEVFYEDGEPWACTEEEVGVVGDNKLELVEVLLQFVKAIEQPILDYDSIGGSDANSA